MLGYHIQVMLKDAQLRLLVTGMSHVNTSLLIFGSQVTSKSCWCSNQHVMHCCSKLYMTVSISSLCTRSSTLPDSTGKLFSRCVDSHPQ